MKKKNDDARLIRAYLNGKDKAFELLFRRYERPLFSFILRFVGERRSAEDMFQQTWYKVLQNLASYRERGAFSSWLFGIANNCCIDYLRKKNAAKIDDTMSESGKHALASDDPLPDDALQNQEGSEWLQSAIEQLPFNQKQVVLLRIYGEMPFKDIAESLSCSLNTVLGRMHYGVTNLKKYAKKFEKVPDDSMC